MTVIRVNGASTSNFPTGADVSSEISLGSQSIGDLSDVSISGITSGQILIWNGSNFAPGADTDTGISNVVEDLSPQLGGDLDLNGNQLTHTGSLILQRSSTAENSGVVVASKNVGSGGDLTHRVPYFFNITDETDSHTFANIHARREGTSERYITLSTFDDDTTNRKDVLEIFRTSADLYGATLQGTLTASPDTGDTPVATLNADLTGSAGNVANAADVLVVTKKHNTSSRFTNIKFQSKDGSNTYHNHSIGSRRTGSGVNDKFFQIYEHDDAGTAAPAELVRFKKNLNYTTSNGLTEMQMTGRINLTGLNADDMPNSNITEVDMDGTTATIHNMLTGIMNFGGSSIANASVLTFSGEATNDAGGGLSTPDRIGQLRFEYRTTEAENRVELTSQQHDKTAQGRLFVDGEKAGVELVPFQVESFTTTERNALSAANGMIIYNSTDSKMQAYAGGSWVNLH
jgi:hypothetical protein